ncbi:microtubule-associated protein futsch [Tribolium castaneum]|uniref:microtubule-associated protein futsch n=1 Tax=Tribolium castaneum TaxID=7070 RepID=UPI0030FE5B67
MEAVNGVSEGDKGGPPPPSPLTGCYLLIVIGEPHCNEHKDIILQRVAKGLLSWDVNDCLVDLEKELAIITEQALEGEEARYGERLIQFASENLVTEILIHPVVSTLAQCVRNLLSSFTRHRHIIHAGYTFANNGSWVLQDGTFSLADFSEAFQEIEVLRVIRAYENGISLDIHCAPEGDWTRLPKDPFTKGCKVRVNPNDVLTTGSPSISSFINYLEPFLVPAEIESVLESSDVVGNIRFSRPTLYVFPGGQGDAALFGINGFNMLLDGGFSRKACFWDFVRHLDRLDAVLLTRLNNSNVNGISAVLKRKKQNAVYPQIGHFFCNIQERKAILSPDGDKDKDPLLINLLDEGQDIVSNLRHLSLTPQVCYRDSEPINLYHKVGHGTLDMYVLSPAKDSKEVREFLQKWNNNDQKLFANPKVNKDFVFPLQNLVSICALLVWQPANPEDTITRILFPGSSPQNKIFEGLDRLKSLEFIKHPVCSEKSLAPTSIIKTKQSMIERIIQSEKPEKKIPVDNKKPPKPDNIDSELKNGEINGVAPEKGQPVKKSDSTESDKSITKTKKIIENGDKPKPKPKTELKPKARSESQQRKIKNVEKKPSPTTPKKQVNGEPKPKPKASPTATPAKSAKDENNRKVVESKIKSAPKREPPPKPPVEKKEPKTERKPISRRPKDISKLSASPQKKVNGVQKPDSISRKGKLDKEGTTDSSTVSTPSADQDSILKKDISKLTTDELQNLKAQELADLQEEQEAVKEIEAVFRKSELQEEKSSDFRKVKDISLDDKLESEEYLIIEKTEIVPEVADANKEEETQKIARDSEESEKQRSGEKDVEIEEKRTEIQDEVQKIITSASDIVKAKEETIEASKEASVTSPEDKIDVSTDKKDNDNENKEVAQESQPDEKGSANIESGATTTAPTLPEDERMPLDEIKEDNGDQIIEEKHVKEDTKEKDVPEIKLPPKTLDSAPKLPPVVGIRLDKQSHIRDIVKTPDEVADLPVHEEVEFDHFDEYGADGKQDSDEGKKEEKDGKPDSEKKVEDDKKTNEAVDKEKTDVDNKKEAETKDDKANVISEDLNKKELSKSPDEEKDTDEHELEQKKEEEKEKVPPPVVTEVKKDEKIKKEEKPVENKKQLDKRKDETKPEEKDELQKLPEVPKHDVVVDKPSEKEKLKEDVTTIHKIDEKLQQLKSDAVETVETEVKKTEEKIVQPAKEEVQTVKEDVKMIEKLDEKLQKLKDEVEEQHIKAVSEVITHTVEEPQHAEPVIITTDSLPESPMTEDHKILEDKLALGQKSPKEREEDVAKIVASVAEVLKSDAPLEEFEGKIPFTIPYKTYTTELRETHITTVESPVTDEAKTIKSEPICPKTSSSYFIEEERKIAPIHEEQEIQETKVSKMIKDSNELMEATSKIISDIKQAQPKDEEIKEEQDADAGTVHRMLVTASSEDGGEEIEICPPGTITFSRSSESSGRSSPDVQSQKQSQKSSIADTFSDGTVIIKSVQDANKLIKDEIKDIKDFQSVIDKPDNGSDSKDVVVDKTKDEPITEKKETKLDEKVEQTVTKSETDVLESTKQAHESIETKPKEVPEEKATEKNEILDIKENATQEILGKDDIKNDITKIEDSKIKPNDEKDKLEESAKILKEEIKEVAEEIKHEADKAYDTAAEKIKTVKEDVESKVENVVKEVEETKSFLGGIIGDIGKSLVNDATKVIDTIHKEIDDVKDSTKTKVEEMKEDLTTKKDAVEHVVKDIKETTAKETVGVLETAKDEAKVVEEKLVEKKKELLEAAKDLEDAIVQNAGDVVEKSKTEIKETKESVEGKIQDVKETLIEQKATAIGVISDVEAKISKDVEAKVSEAKKELEDVKDKVSAEIKEVSKQAEQKTESVKQEIEEAKTETKELIDESKKVLEETKDKIAAKAESQIKDLETKVESVLNDLETKQDEIKENLAETKKEVEETFAEKKDTVMGKLEQLDKDITKVGTDLKDTVCTVSEAPFAAASDKKEENKYDLYNGLESVEKMVVDVLTADREKPSTDDKQGESIAHKIESEIESIVEKGVSEVKEFVEETKEAVTSIFKHDSEEKEEVLEKAAGDIERKYEVVADMAKSVIFEKCDKTPEEEHQKQEEFLEKAAKNIEDEFKTVSDMSQSIVFEKYKPLNEEEREEKILEKAAKGIEEDYNAVTDMAQSIVFEKYQPLTEEAREEKVLEKVAHDIEDNFSKVSQMSQSVVFEKCEPSSKDEKESKSDKQDDKKASEETTKLSGKVSPALSKESSGKSTPDVKHSELMKADQESKSDKTEGEKIVQQENQLSGKASPALSSDLAKESSGKSTPDIKDSQPMKTDQEKQVSGKASPALSSDLAKESSGKSTPDIKDSELMKVDHDSLLSGKSSPGLSGKSSPVLSGGLSPGRAESKDSLLSGKSTPEQMKPVDKELSGKSSPALTTDGKDKLEKTTISTAGSGKSSPETKIEEKAKEPELKDVEKKIKEEKTDLKIAEEAKSSNIPEKKTETEKDQKLEPELKTTLGVQETEKKASVSDIQITLKASEESSSEKISDVSKTDSPEDPKQPDDKTENKDVDSIDSGIGTDVDGKSKKTEEVPKPIEPKTTESPSKTTKEESIAGPSTTSLTPAKTSTEELHLSGKSTPDIAEVERMKEIQETLKHEKHIPGSSTPPTVPVSPNVKEISPQPEATKTPIKSSITQIKDSELRSCTPGSDDFEIGASTYSDISSGQVSRAPNLLESERIESDEDDDVPGSPMSVTSQVAHSRSSSRYDFEDERIGTKLDPMNTSFYGALPDENEPELEFEKAMVEHRQTRGEDLVGEDSSSYLYEITKAKFSSTPEPQTQTQLDQINKNGASDVMTASFMGDLPSESKKDAFDSWGKPLGLPSPAPPNDNRGTPKKERKLPLNVSAKNKLNDDKKRSESPSKYRNKKFNPVYVDLTYVPHHGNAYYSYVDFFKRVRARYYVFSGIEPSREVYNALLEAKQTWEDKELEVTIIPTYDTDILGYWVAENEELLTKYKIDLSPSASRCTINLQDHETSCSAYRLEF